MQGDADLILAYETLEAVRAAYFARKKKNAFVVNNSPYVPVFSNLLKISYPIIDEIIKRVRPFAREIHLYDAHNVAKREFGKRIFGNTLLIGTAVGSGLLPLKEKSLKEAIKITVPRGTKKNLKAFELGLKIGKKK
jgi:Pyruvate/2-oxoacid:ferredoxin oxidoreductase gamma subunit